MSDQVKFNKNSPSIDRVLTSEAVNFIKELHLQFNDKRKSLLRDRTLIQKDIDAGNLPNFLTETLPIREDLEWVVAEVPSDLEKRTVEITGPTDKKMVINALNSGADVFMADFEDANAPTWQNMIEGQVNLIDAVTKTLSFSSAEGKKYQLKDKTAVLMIRPRGFHLEEKNFTINGEPISASFFDFGLYLFHNFENLKRQGTGPYFYLPKLENHLEARLWNEVFKFSEEKLSLPNSTIKVTVLLETILAAFQMEEILYELKNYIVGMNAGRWDYIFSIIKKFHKQPGFSLPDREEITMTVPFMQAYTELLVATCHKRKAHAIGGMAAFIPSRSNKEVNEKAIAKVIEDKKREVEKGFDGTWVAHPDLVSIARDVFEEKLKGNPHQKDVKKNINDFKAQALRMFVIPNAEVSEEGIRKSIKVALQYLAAWLSGQGAIAIDYLMEDAATAEICRSEIWLWAHQRQDHIKEYKKMVDEELKNLKSVKNIDEAKLILEELVLAKDFPDFLTTIAYEKL